MLVLTRKIGEEILIPTYGITITVLGIESGRVRMGITAPPEIRVLRGELVQQGAKTAKEPAAVVAERV